jgi:diguanylate cyclase (GGDEF)-like protein/PAS domain S-box-containing protein
MRFNENFNFNCQSLLDNMPAGIYFTDCDRKIIYWNKAAEKLTGYPASEVLGYQCFDNILKHINENGKNLCKSECPLAKTISDGNPRKGEVFLHHKNGHRVAVEINTIPLRDRSNKIVGAMEIFTDVTTYNAVQSKIQELEKIAYFDKLTNLPNREHIEAELDLRFHEFKRYNKPFGLLFMDIDHFKRFNDTYGHEAGDMILKTVSATLRSASRPFDIFGRWGGEEFIGIIREVDKDNLLSIGNRYLKLIEKSSILLDKKRLGITVSIGATIVSHDDSKHSIIKRADQLMYQCKQQGRNCLASD